MKLAEQLNEQLNVKEDVNELNLSYMKGQLKNLRGLSKELEAEDRSQEHRTEIIGDMLTSVAMMFKANGDKEATKGTLELVKKLNIPSVE